jgi:hypothetical protein
MVPNTKKVLDIKNYQGNVWKETVSPAVTKPRHERAKEAAIMRRSIN